jgi:hypothetical protein
MPVELGLLTLRVSDVVLDHPRAAEAFLVVSWWSGVWWTARRGCGGGILGEGRDAAARALVFY